jgi:Putative zinc-finger
MDHSESLRLQAAEKYALGELPPELRDEYEEHYFTCEECASDVAAAAAFLDAGRAAALTSAERGGADVHAARQPAARWFQWLRPAFAVPAFAVLLLLVTYQNVITIPQLKNGPAASTGQDADLVSLIGANSRSEGVRTVQLHRNKPAILDVDIPPSQEFTGYLCQLQDAAGRFVFQAAVSAVDARQTVHLVIPREVFRPGSYNLLVLGENSAGSRTEVARLPFNVEFLP